MHVALDASHLNQKSMSGTHYFFYYVVKELSKLPIQDDFTIYTKFDLSDDFINDMTNNKSNYKVKHLKSSSSWTQVTLARQLVKDDVDVLFAPWQTMPIIHNPKMKILSVVHDLDYTRLRFGPTLFTSYFSDKILAVSKTVKKQIVEKYKINPDKIDVVYEGVDKNKYFKREESNISQTMTKYNIDSEYVLFVGTMVERKNISNLIKGFSKFKQKYETNIKLVLGGIVPNDMMHLKKLPSQVSIKDDVLFIGRIDDNDIAQLISGAKAYLYVSKSEGFGLPILEAMSCEVPTLVSNIDVLSEVGGEATYKVDPYNIEEISEGIHQVTKNEKLRKELIDLGRKQSDKYGWDNTAKIVMNNINKLYRDINGE